MTLESLRHFFLIMFIANYVILIIWFVWYAAFYSALKKLVDTFLRRPTPNFESIMVAVMTLYKILIVLFCLTPWIALSIMS